MDEIDILNSNMIEIQKECRQRRQECTHHFSEIEEEVHALALELVGKKATNGEERKIFREEFDDLKEDVTILRNDMSKVLDVMTDVKSLRTTRVWLWALILFLFTVVFGMGIEVAKIGVNLETVKKEVVKK